MTDKTLAAFAADMERSGIRKPTKVKAQHSLKSIFEEHADQLSDDALFHLGQLYRYFMPAAPRTPKTLEQWVAKAAGKKDVRYYLNYVYADPAGFLVATNGHRMHVMDLPEGMKPGYYCPKTLEWLQDHEEWRYPDWQRIMPTPARWLLQRLDISTWAVDEIEDKAVYRMPDGVALNKQYVDEALAMPGATMTHYYQESENAPVLFVGAGDDGRRIESNPRAVIMTMRG